MGYRGMGWRRLSTERLRQQTEGYTIIQNLGNCGSLWNPLDALIGGFFPGTQHMHGQCRLGAANDLKGCSLERQGPIISLSD